MIFFKFLFIFDRERERERELGRGREREGDTGSRLRVVCTESDVGLELMNHEIMTWDEVGRLTDWATQVPLQVNISDEYWYKYP